VSGPRYLLRPSVESFCDRHGALCFVRPGEQDLLVRDPEPADVTLVARLRGPAETACGLADVLGLDVAVVQAKLDSLVSAGLVLARDAAPGGDLSDEDAERFSRQLPYLAELGDEIELQRRLRGSRVVVLGCGGLGTWVVAGVACIGVGTLVLVDDDHVSLSNLNRQILYAAGDVGARKVAATARWIRAFDPAIGVEPVPRRVESEADLRDLVVGADAVVLAADWPPYEIGRWVNAVCIRAGIPFLVAGQMPPVIKVGPTYIAGEGPCFACHERALAQGSEAYDDYVAFRSSDAATASTVGPASCVAGGLLALELMHLLVGERPVTRDLALLVHMRTLEVEREPVRRDPACPACKHLR
jgi:bacteriocin biosynthesis cyclodehydratase domain-containing protein